MEIIINVLVDKMELKFNQKKDKCQIILEPKEEVYILSKNDRHYFLQVMVDECNIIPPSKDGGFYP